MPRHLPKYAVLWHWPANSRSPEQCAQENSHVHIRGWRGAEQKRTRRAMTNRWWIYQRERFPVMAHSPLILAFSLSAVSFSSLLRGASSLPGWKPCAVAFATSFLTFLQLRLADEFKDFEADSQFRPYRPVP